MRLDKVLLAKALRNTLHDIPLIAYTTPRHESDIFCGLCASLAFLAVKFSTAKDAEIYAKYAKKNVRLLPGEGISYCPLSFWASIRLVPYATADTKAIPMKPATAYGMMPG